MKNNFKLITRATLTSVNGMFVPSIFSTISPAFKQSLQYMISSQTNSTQY